MLNKNRSSRRHTWKYLLIVPALIITAGLLSASNPPLVKVNGEKYIQTANGNTYVILTPHNWGSLITDSLYKKRFPGGAEAFTKFVSKNIRYPRVAQEANASGVVTAQFQLSPDGSVKGVKVINAARKEMGEEVERLLNTLPKFDAAPSGKTETILFTVVFLMRDEYDKHTEPDLSKVKADILVVGYGVMHKQQ
ncbi:TonB family C-terminal domain-containing protein [Chitinophaga sp. YR573]|uniref:TonB family protein n=1 Tax=Chitinophaga sp. YR573 TaxID=1881040 RepID=UPI0008C9EB2B|nr:TonB family protein [Chitinophaga sp. YR573]SEW29488.1 TonB family C-terminal domain-containing protein [Chitinophaga sp. YR573]